MKKLSFEDIEIIKTYIQSLEIENPSVEQQEESRRMTEYMIERGLDISDLPELKYFDEEYEALAKQMDPFTFLELYSEFQFIGKDNTVLDIEDFVKKNNIHKDRLEVMFKKPEANMVDSIKLVDEEYKKQCAYLAKKAGLPEYMGELLVSEIKKGDKSNPEIVNRAVNIGLLDKSFYID